MSGYDVNGSLDSLLRGVSAVWDEPNPSVVSVLHANSVTSTADQLNNQPFLTGQGIGDQPDSGS